MPEITERLSTALADRYQIKKRLGEGGMATVYLAKDLKHDRKVALKVLKAELAAVLGAERFVQEIKTTASLQHPHILPLFDSGEADSFLYYVMPFIDGETLREKLNRETQLSIDEAVSITTSIADALHYAHGEGVIHRDIKPENILIHNGRPMVADFGIALAVSAAAGGRMTETGLSLGTPHYMSPEQATAEKDITARSDVYSLGSVLYEMLTGEPPHTGASAQAIIMKIVTDEARSITELRKSVPLHVSAATGKALEKLPADRFETASLFAEALNNPTFSTPRGTAAGATETTQTTWQHRMAVPALFATAVLLITTLWGWSGRSGNDTVLTTYDVGLPEHAPMLMEYGTMFAIAPNGDFVVYVSADSTRSLWYRSLVDGTVRPIPGTENATNALAISPNGERVAFTADGLMKVASVTDGQPSVVAEITEVNGLQWLSNVELFFADSDGQALRWIDVDTGEDRYHTTDRCVIPQVLPGGDQVVCSGGGTQYLTIVDVAADSLLMPTGRDNDGTLLRGADFRLIDGQYLTFMSVAGDLRAVPFDPLTLQFGRPITMVPGVRREAYTGSGQYEISDNGTIVYVEGINADVGQMVIADPGQEPTPLADVEAFFLRWDIAPDGERIAAVVEGIQAQELHIYDARTDQDQLWASGSFLGEPMWSPSGDRLTVNSFGPVPQRWALLSGSPNTSSPPDTILTGAGWSFDLYTYNENGVAIGNTWGDPTMVVSIDFNAEPIALDTVLPNGFFAALSPDAEWLSYMQFQRRVTMISPYPSLDRQFLVSDSDGEGQWLSSTELVAWRCCATFYKATIDAAAANPVVNFEEWHRDDRFSDTPGHSYSLTPDGRLVYVRAPEGRSAPYLRVVPNWVEQMKRAVDEANR